jgi:hypothetical protein
LQRVFVRDGRRIELGGDAPGLDDEDPVGDRQEFL